MFIDIPDKPNGLVIVCDVRLKHDRDLQEKLGGQPVLRFWPFGSGALGKRAWAHTTRIALYDYGSKVTPEMKVEAKSNLLAWLLQNKPRCTLVLQTRSSDIKSKDDMGDAADLIGTHCWVALKAPDRLPEMAGCVWNAPWGSTIGVLNPVNYEYVFRELIRRHMLLGLHIANHGYKAPAPNKLAFLQDTNMSECLDRLLASAQHDVPLAVDIETFSDLSLITAIGVSDGEVAVAVPFESFNIFGTNRVEAGGTKENIGKLYQILHTKCSKIFHNYTFDVPMLESKGFSVRGSIHDTMAMHVVVYKQWPHGLQKACSQELLVTPWKSEHKPQGAKKLGLTKKDARYWICNPEETRHYCCFDAFNTWRLGYALAPKVGIEL